ncbi:ExeM/NucH family extracellular endonuclease [Persicitalea jodogahamensis]|uniref:Extracellular nuclease n=1 Tax=Persicitalea jodogahamensis TaxID=402147 RepID=A0A8J3D3R6_9BACT|nr:ExeM/NucH family extracellular endonuclease [Persicitalea jodogahamensis]GHB68230.1 hypothetical protein GCM10007390_21950 [Persicitalea jodogahamensis]
MNKQLLKFCLFLILPALLGSGHIFGQSISLTTSGTAYTQDFNTLSNTASSTTNDLTISGWFLSESGSSVRNNGQYAVGTGSDNSGDVYSFGSTGSTDRAIGGLRSGSLVPVFGASFTNNTGSTIASIEISYTGEEWRLGTANRTDQLNFEYSTDATNLTTGSWTGVSQLNFITPFTATAGVRDGNISENRTNLSGTITGLSIANGATFWIRFTDTDASGADDGLAVDDFSLTPNGAATAPIVVINEIDSDSPTEPVNDAAEFIELYDGGVGNTDLSGLVVVLFNGNGDVSYAAYDLDGKTTNADGYFVLGNSGVPGVDAGITFSSNTLQNGADAVALYRANASDFPNGTSVTETNLLDAIVYDTNDSDDSGLIDVLTPGQAQINENGDGDPTIHSLQRIPNGAGGLRNTSAYQALAPTPNAANGVIVTPPTEPTARFIHVIQGNGATSPLTNTAVTIEGVVTRTFTGSTQLNGFYVQEEDADADADPATSEGIFVYDPGARLTPSVGDKVQVTGTVAEFTSGSSSLTQLADLTSASVISSGAPLPAVVTVKLPVANVSDLERYEGMLVEVSATEGNLAVTEYFQLGRFGQVVLSATGASNVAGTDARLDQYTQFNAPSTAGFSAYLAEVAKRKIILDDGSSVSNPDPIIFGRGGQPLSANNTLRGGDEVSSVTAILDERFEGYRLQTTTGVNFMPTNQRPANPPAVGGTLHVGSFNLLNYFNGNGTGGGFPTARGANTPTEFARQRDKTIKAIVESGVDVFALNELENDGYGANSAIQDLVNGVNAATAPGTFAIIDPGTSISTDAITVGIIYKPAKVTPVGAAATLTTSAAFNATGRQPLAQTFKENATNAEFTVVANHWKSKGSSAGGAGDADINDGQGASNGTRTRQAQDLAAWLATNPTGTSDADYLVLGDLNAYAEEDPLTALENAGYVNLVPNTTYSYVFDGFFGALDHALGSPSMVSQVTGATKWHINADEPLVLDYNTENKTVGQQNSLYNPDQFRTSDHDPVIVGLSLTVPVPELVVSITSSTNVLCNGGTTGSIELTVSGGKPTYSFSWSNGATVEDLSGLPAGKYVVTVTDQAGQVAKDSVTISQPAAIAVTPVADKSVILGFGSNCTDISASATGGTGTLNYLWQPGNLSGSTVQVCPTATTTYTVTVTDANNCTATAQVKVNVNDVRCGNKNQNVTICYYGVTQCVSEKIAERYLKLGATIGGCGSNARIGAEEVSAEKPFALSVQAYPNPTTGALTLRIQSVVDGPAVLDVLDMAGLPVQQRVENLVEGTNEISVDLNRQTSGIYLIRCRDAAGRQAVVRVHRQ